ncbi:histidine phosphatase family protein [Utexia brackfieldae]|uniref:histidine phosphatase family protein n=1 Tax=Utexia brackfieldae TaxID=3074108 RepID=UPI00370DB8CF
MRKLFPLVGLLVISLGLSQVVYANQTIVFVRHGEKPHDDSGQLSCKGLNRSLALPEVLLNRYGKPDAIYAAAPKQQKLGSSLRAVQTIAPTATRLSQPIHQEYHAKQIDEMQHALLDKNYRDALIFVVWEHNNLTKIVQGIISQAGGDPTIVPKWKGSDFDSIYIVHIDRDDHDKITATFEQAQEGLNDVSDQCGVAKR